MMFQVLFIVGKNDQVDVLVCEIVEEMWNCDWLSIYELVFVLLVFSDYVGDNEIFSKIYSFCFQQG